MKFANPKFAVLLLLALCLIPAGSLPQVWAQSLGVQTVPPAMTRLLSTSSPATGNSLTVRAFGAAIIEVTGTFSGLTLVIDSNATVGPTTIDVVNYAGYVQSSTITAAGKYFVAAAGIESLTPRVTAIGSGTIEVWARVIPSVARARPEAAGGGGGAPSDATFITQTPNSTLTNEQALSALSTGLLKNTTGTGVLSIGTKSDIGLGNVDNTSDAGKPVSTAQQTALDLKAPLAAPVFTTSASAPFFVSAAADPADAGAIRLGNNEVIGWEKATTGTDWTLGVNASDVLATNAPFTSSGAVSANNYESTGSTHPANGWTQSAANVLTFYTGSTLAFTLGATQNAIFPHDVAAGTFNKLTLTQPATGSTLTIPDGVTLNAGAGGTLGSNAFNSTAYLPLAGGTLTGNLIFTDNTLDIGASGATRPRTIYVGTSVVSPLETIGFGATAPPSGPLLAVATTINTSPRGIASMQFSTDTAGARVGFFKARGTVASPTTIVTGDTLGRLMFRGYVGATNAYVESASVEAVSTGTVADTSTGRLPSQLILSTSTDASPSVLTTALTLDQTQQTLFSGNALPIGATQNLGSAALPWLSSFVGNTTQYESVTQSAGLITHSALGSATDIGYSLVTKGAGSVTIPKPGIGATSTDGIVLANTTAAAAGAQQWSPRLHLIGQGWKTTATAASQTVDWIAEAQPVQGTANPTSSLVLSSQVNGGGYTNQFSLDSGGNLTLQNNLTIGASLVVGSAAAGSGPAGQVAVQYVGANKFRIGTNSSGVDLRFHSSDSKIIFEDPLVLTTYDGTKATFIRRVLDANVALGNVNNASPVANIFTIGESSRGGTDSNVAGANGTIQSGTGTGTGAVASLIFQTPTVGSSGTTQQTYGTRLTLNSSAATFTGNVTATSLDAATATSLSSITGGASNMTITSGTGASRTMILRTTTSGSTATTALTLDETQQTLFSGNALPIGATQNLGSAALPWLSSFVGNTTQYESVTQSAGLITHSALGSATDIGYSLETKGAGSVTIPKPGIGATSTDGIVLANTTAAAAGAQQWSPRLRLTGQGRATNSGGSSQTVDWIAEVQPVQGTANPTSNLVFSSQVNGGGYVLGLTLTSGGLIYGSASPFAATLNFGTPGLLKIGRLDTTAKYVSLGYDGDFSGICLNAIGRLGWQSSVTDSGAPLTQDLILTRAAAANLQLGAATSATAAVAQTLSVSGSSGNSAAAALFTIAGSDQSGTTTTGGGVKIRGGNGTSAGGAVEIWTSATTTPAVALSVAADKSVTLANTISTADPTSGAGPAWKLGAKKTGTLVLDTTNYIEISVAGVTYKVALIQ